MAKGRDIDEVQGSAAKAKRPSDVVDLFQLGPKYTTVRLVGPVFMYGGHWVKTKNKEGKPANFYTGCLSFDPETGRKDSSKKCPWCDHDTDAVRFSIDYYSNAIIRREQKNRPERLTKPTKAEEASGFKDKDSDTWTPYGALRAPYSVIRSLKELKELNVHEDAEGTSTAFNISHPKFGIDVMIKKDEKAAPAQMYSVQKGEHKPLTKEERSFLLWDLSDLAAIPDAAATNKDYAQWAKKMGFTVHAVDSDDEDDEDTPRPKKKGKPADEDDDKSGFDDDEDDEPSPKAKAKKKPVVEEDDEDDEPAPKAKKKPVVVDEDDEDDEPVPKAKAKKKPVIVDDEDDEDDEPVPKAKAKKKPVVEDDDEDDEPVPKAKAKRKPVVEDDEDDEPAPKAKAKKKPVVEDDDEDF